ncbi:MULTISPECIES: response regulator [Pseudanabaena]|uniref:response regulator n=1 Tax=Pseudanabaena TaxID=1152 RepID=UPI002478F851|nr:MULTISPECIES: response regulator [Pseudanabaena]MEA5485221.1 response regulator [Pseudanabaena sp. CCNP1317]WGS72648.1 response regulator [Pseudanabaena galeata CCNP1313]
MKQSKLLKKLLTASERSFITIDRQFVITDTSYGAERFSEYPYESLLNKDIRNAFPEIIGLEESFNNIWLNQLTSLEIKGVCRSLNPQEPLYFNFYIIGTNELEEEDKNIIICIEDATDVMIMSQTLMQRANESDLLANALLKSKEYIDKIISAMADSLIVTDYQGKIKTINPAAINLFGYSQDELVNGSIASLFKNPNQLDLIHQNYLKNQLNNEQLLDSDRYFTNIEILCLSKTSEEILISFSCSTIQNHQLEYNVESSHNFVYVGRNITELKRKEQELLAARQFAEQSAKAKTIFLANMSHEIRTPMNGVLGMTELLLATPLDDRQQDFVENIRLSGNLLLSLINRILDLSKLEEGQLKLENLPFDLNKCIEEILELFALQAHNQGLEINACFDKGLPNLLIADTVRFRQIMMNLIGNAIKFTTEGEIVVRVERDRNFEQDNPLTNKDSPQSPVYLRFSVIDTGIGIDSKNQDKLFKPFSQVDTSTNRRFGGTGLGLAICRQLVELMQGEIGVSSPVENGKGTCFWFRIPFALQPISNPPPLDDNAHALGKRSILVVDANRHTRHAIGYELAKFGAEVYEVSNIVDALKYLDTSHKVDVAIIDWGLTSFNGSKLVQLIHGKEGFADLPIMAMLTANRQGETETIIHQGFCGYVTKPFKAQRLLKSLYLSLGIEHPVLPNDSAASAVIHHLRDNSKPNIGLEELRKSKILLAEDNIVNQKVTMTYLSQLGCQADLAENGEQVLELMQSKDYDIILMDCQMPLLDGYATTQVIRQLESTTRSSKHVVIIAMTANAFTEDRDRCLAMGMDDFLSKPIRRQQLKETLEDWIIKQKLKENLRSWII